MSAHIRGWFSAMALATASLAANAADPTPVRIGVPAIETVYIVIYRPGERWSEDRSGPMRDHGRYMLQLYRQGTLRHAGPFDDNRGGAVIFTAPDDATAEAVVTADPAVSAQTFAYELKRWTWVDWSAIAARQPVLPSK